MFARWILLIYILKILLNAVTSHRHVHHSYKSGSRRHDSEDEYEDYEEASDNLTRRSKNYFNQTQHHYSCSCSCDQCYTNVKKCCEKFCKVCEGMDLKGFLNDDIGFKPDSHEFVDERDFNDYTETDDNYQYPEAIPNPNAEQKVVFVPYPYPLIVPNAERNTSNSKTEKPKQQKTETTTTEQHTTKTTTAKTTTTKTVTTTPTGTKTTKKATTPIYDTKTLKNMLREKSMEVSMLSRHRKMKQLNPIVKRNKPAWVPKYGIVPIPDHLAVKLMSQLTEVRALKARKL